MERNEVKWNEVEERSINTLGPNTNSNVGLNKGCKTIIISSIGSVQDGNVELIAKENNS